MTGDDLGAWIRRSRRALDLTQAQLADAVGCTESMLKKIETGLRQPSPQLHARVVRYLTDAAAPLTTDDLPFERLSTVVAGAKESLTRAAPGWPAVYESASVGVRSAPSLHSAIQVALDLNEPIGVHAGLDEPRVLAAVAQRLFERRLGLLLSPAAATLTGRLPPGWTWSGDTENGVLVRSLGSSVSVPATLAAPPNSFIGRDDTVRLLRSQLNDPEHRLITIVGPPGSGKTRLALETVQQTRTGPETVIVDLSPYDTATDALVKILRDLGAPPPTAVSASTAFVTWMRSWKGLLVLDSVEHVRDIGLVLASAVIDSSATILTTSRVPLRVRGEHEILLGPLELGSAGTDDSSLAPAIQLFVDRAQLHAPNASALRTIAAICDRLDGLPLAIELAASRARDLPLSVLLRRLEERLSDLATDVVDLPERHRTLAAAIEWSISLLDQERAAALVRLSVFNGPFDLDAVASVGLDWPRHAALSPDELMATLTSHHLVRTHTDTDGMWSMYATVRDVARSGNRLGVDEHRSTTQRFRSHVLYEARSLSEELYGDSQTRASDRLTLLFVDLRAVLQTLSDPAAELDDEHRLLGADVTGRLLRFWSRSGLFAEGRMFAEGFLSLDCVTAHHRARLLVTSGTLAFFQGDLDEAGDVLGKGLREWEKLGDRQGMADALTNLAAVAGTGGDLVLAERRVHESMSLYAEAGDLRGEAIALGNLGHIARDRGDLESAEKYLAASAAIHRERQDQYLLVEALQDLALTLDERGRTADAIAALHDAISLDVTTSSERVLASTADIVALLAVRRHPLLAVAKVAGQLLGGADELRRRAHIDLPTAGPRAEAIALVGTLVGARLWRSLTEEGQGRSTGELVALMDVLLRNDVGDHDSIVSLTGRELDVLSRIAAGDGDKAIARDLGLRPATIAAHMRSVQLKLGAPSRAAAVRAAMAAGLI